jgi:hypothetical protein
MHCLIGFDQDARALQGLGPLPRQVTRDYFGFRCDSDLAQFTAVRAGVGIGGCQHIIARDFRELVPLLAKAIRFELEDRDARRHEIHGPGPDVIRPSGAGPRRQRRSRRDRKKERGRSPFLPGTTGARDAD